MRFLRLAAIGAGLAYFLDPQHGRARRAQFRDRALALVRRRSRDVSRLGKTASARAYGMKQKATHIREEPKDYDDQTLKSKVESEVFRPADAPKGQVDVNVENGVVTLRGEVDRPELVDDLEQKVRKVQGVRDVENMLHVPGAGPQRTTH